MAKSRSELGQLALPDCPADVAGQLRNRAQGRLMPGKPQKPCDIGLFSDDANQIDLEDLVSYFTEQSEE